MIKCSAPPPKDTESDVQYVSNIVRWFSLSSRIRGDFHFYLLTHFINFYNDNVLNL